MADRAQRGAADLAHPLGHRIGDGEDLLGLLVEQQMVVAEMRPADVPVEVLGLEIEREGVGEEPVQRRRDFLSGLRRMKGWGFKAGKERLFRSATMLAAPFDLLVSFVLVDLREEGALAMRNLRCWIDAPQSASKGDGNSEHRRLNPCDLDRFQVSTI